MNLLKQIILAISIGAVALSAQAQSPAEAINTVDAATQNNIGTSNTTETYEDSAREAGSKTKTGSTLAKAASAFAFVMAAVQLSKQNYAKAAWYTAGGIAGLMLAKSMDKTSSKNNAIADTFVTGNPIGGTDPNNSNNPGGTDLSDNTGDGYDDINNAIDDLRGRGVTINPNTGEFVVNGKKYNANDFKSAESMAAAGMSQSQIDGFLAAMKDVRAAAEEKVGKAADAVAGFEDGGAAGSSAAAAADESYGGVAGKAKYGINRDPSNVAGLSKDFKGQPIGVAGDSLFSMIHRRYDLHEKKGSFLGP